ncbi:GNAT family N-acetyltransferase [Streptomyces sp. NPDC058287]|uniref:GNAT family N-acetyltransferase n=1 Tax=Streptomyces sp. NPDC058287 TaxID=3346423 RepID=UPI0036EE499A
MYHIEEVLPDANEYQMLRTAVGWASPSEAACQPALDGTSFGVVARHAERIVGMGRLVGDAAMYSFIVDVVVHPDHQGAGLGRRMVDALVNWPNTHGIRTTLLIASSDVVPFYEPFGFTSDPSSVMKYAPDAPTASDSTK